MTTPKLTEAQAIEILAKWLGLKGTNVCYGDEFLGFECFNNKDVYFNPYTSWDDFRLLEERIMEDGKGKLCKDYLKYFDGKAHYFGSDLEERLDALIPLLTP